MTAANSSPSRDGFELPDERTPVVIAARRTAIGRAGGALAGVEVSPLIATVIRAVMSEVDVKPKRICDVLVGNAVAGGGNVARLAALEAGLPVDVPGVTVDRQCGSGLEAIVLACRLVASGAGDVYLAGGGESVSTAPWRVRQPTRPGALPAFYHRAQFAPESTGDPDMGVAAENVAATYRISRQRQDEYALRSHHRAVDAQRSGRFAEEITEVATSHGPVTVDECPRQDTSLAALSALRPLFAEDGTVTAGNSCPLNDGAAMALVTSKATARELGCGTGLGLLDATSAGVDPNLLGIGPVASTRLLLSRHAALDLAAIPRIEFNEAFASQVLASADLLGIDPQLFNPDGGALALGHPFGASGAILVTRLFSQLVREPSAPPVGTRALAMMGIAGGLGITALFQSLSCEPGGT